MASKLYTYLQSINHSRERMIKILKEDGVSINSDASFAAIAGNLDNITKTREDNNDLNKNYYDDPEQDPLVWKRPKIYNQIDIIWEQLQSYTHSDFNCTMYPAGIIVFQINEVNNIIIRGSSKRELPSTNYMSNPLDNNILNIAYIKSSYSSYYPTYLDIHINENNIVSWYGEEIKGTIPAIECNSSDIFTIYDEDNIEYKYIILYSNRHEEKSTSTSDISASSSHLSDYLIGNIIAGEAIILPYVILNPSFTHYSNVGFLTNLPTQMYWIKFDDTPTRLTQEEYDSLKTYDTLKYAHGLYLGNSSSSNNNAAGFSRWLKRFEVNVDLPKSTILLNPYYMAYSRINTYISNRSISANYSEWNGYQIRQFPNTITYIKCYRMHPSALARQGTNAGTSYPESISFISPTCDSLKYLTITASDEIQDQYVYTETVEKFENDDSTSYRRRFYYYPNLRISELYKVIKYRVIIDGLKAYDDGKIATLSFPNIQHIIMSSGYFDNINIIAEKFDGRALTVVESTTTSAFYGRNIDLPSLTNPVKKISIYANEEAHLENLTTLSTGVSISGRAEKYYLPMLSSLGDDFTFGNNAGYTKYILLPEGFKFNIILNTSASTKIHNRILLIQELAEKAGIVQEGEVFTLKLEKDEYVNELFWEAVQTFIKKGWTISAA